MELEVLSLLEWRKKVSEVFEALKMLPAVIEEMNGKMEKLEKRIEELERKR